MKTAVGIASSDRRDVLSDTIAHLRNQTQQADSIIVCPARPEHFDADAIAAMGLPVTVVYGAIGLPAQRNTIMRACNADLLIFFDDDFLPAPDFIASAAMLFSSEPDIVVATGEVLADGILGPGLDLQQGLAALDGAQRVTERQVVDVFNAYGCNMVFRLQPIRAHGLMFDEKLPLYAWLEDVDFSRQLAPHGRIVRSSSLRGVHLGTKRSGRTPGRKLGYSQIANRVYLARKGSLPWSQAWIGMARNIGANVLHWRRPEPWVDRRGRLRGNLLAFRDWFLGDIAPDRILQLD